MKSRFSFIADISWHWVVLLLLLPCWSARASVPNITAGERAILPEYCADAQTFGYGDAYFNTSPRAPYWVGLMGKNFWHMHHFCWSLIREHRSRAAGVTRYQRDFHLTSAIGDYIYVIENGTPDFVLLPEIYTRIGENHVLLGNIGAALDAFTAARAKKPDYWPPYTAWARVLLKAGKRQEALAHVEIVMKLVPDDAELRRQYNSIKNGPAGAVTANVRASKNLAAAASASSRRLASTPGGAIKASAAALSGKPSAASAVSRQ